MSNPNITIIEGLSNTPIVREMTADEAKHFADRRQEAIAETTAENNRAIKKQAVLDKLGITADEAALLLG